MDIYAPLANRLGIARFKGELEDLSFKYLDPQAYHDLVGKVSQDEARARPLHHRRQRRRSPAGSPSRGSPPTCTGRAKHLYSIYRKMKTQECDYEQVYDVIAFRVVVESVADCYAALGVIHSQWTPDPGPLQGLRRAAQAEHVPVAPHDGDRSRAASASRSRSARTRCSASPSTASRRTGSTRRSISGGVDPEGRGELRLAPPAHGVPEGA